ncbi:MAG TPA: hypothetical protein VFA07_02600 [Chthonomonadaceae bacterium]|nr:hypothetical protein [Chthonomonadaceae bacterium]
MNETEKQRILKMVAEGALRPSEAAHLLAALAEESENSNAAKADGKAKPKPQEPMLEVQMQRPDGTHYVVQVPPNLGRMLWEMSKVAIKESARNTTKEAWSGFKHMVRNKTQEVKVNVQTRLAGGKSEEAPALSPEQEQQAEARRRILQMVQNGRITAVDASHLIQQLDAMQT